MAKRRQVSLNKEIRELIKIQDEVTRSDLQGLAEALSIKLVKDYKELQDEISERILKIVDSSNKLSELQLKYEIAKLSEDITQYKKANRKR